MNFTALDWWIVGVVYAAMAGGVWLLRPFMRGVTDFLAAGRTAGRYMLSVSQGVAALGAISVVGFLEQNYVAGFSLTWWGLSTAIVVLLISVTGFVVYRFRETRCLTLAEFFERRYSRSFRIFMGLLAFLSGIINFGIFPAVGARFFIQFAFRALDRRLAARAAGAHAALGDAAPEGRGGFEAKEGAVVAEDEAVSSHFHRITTRYE